MFNNFIHRRVYDVETSGSEQVRTFAVYNSFNECFVLTENNKLVTYMINNIVVFEELSLELPSHISLENSLAECKRHSRKLVYTSLQINGGQGWVHYDDRMPCNEQVKASPNIVLLEFLTFLHTIGTLK